LSETGQRGENPCDDRSSIDEILFAAEVSYPSAGMPAINEEVAEDILRTDEPEPYPAPLFPCYGGPGVIVGGEEYEFTSVEPRAFEVRGEPIEPVGDFVFPVNGYATKEPAADQEAEFVHKTIPVLAVSAGLALATGETVPITAAHLRLDGGEPVLLDVMLLSAPMHGALIRDGFALTGGDIFTQEDVNEGRLHYRHDGGTEERDGFTFATPEGEVPPTVFAITIEPGHREPEPVGEQQFAEIGDALKAEEVVRGTVSEGESPFEPGPACPWVGAPTVAELLGGAMAVVRIAGEGRWQYSLDDGRTWRDFGPVYHGRARLLRAGDRIRFRPRKGAEGVIILAGRPWNETSGRAGSTVSLARRGSHGKGTAFADFVRSRTWELDEG
jgi:hypothetical protein